MNKILNISLSILILVTTSNALAAANTTTATNICQSADGLTTVKIQSLFLLHEGRPVLATHEAELVLNGKDIPRLTEKCMLTPGIKAVVRCPGFITDQNHAEVYPKFKKDDGTSMEKATIIINSVSADDDTVSLGTETVVLKNCRKQ